MPVLVTPVKKRPSKRASRALRARYWPAWSAAEGGEGVCMALMIRSHRLRMRRFRTCGCGKNGEGAAYNVPPQTLAFAQGHREDRTVQLAPSIFKAYDIRGVVPSTLTEDIALGLGRAFGTVAMAQGETTVAVGRDGRLSGPSLAAALMRGLQEAGVAVIDVGMVTTPDRKSTRL